MTNWRLEDDVPPPLAGNPDFVGQFGRRYAEMATALSHAVDELTALANEGVTISVAIDEVRERADDAIAMTRKVKIRYAGASRTLIQYSNSLSDAQVDANSARNIIITNNPNAGYWRRRERDLEHDLRRDMTNDEIIKDLQEATNRVNQYDQEFLDAIRAYNSAVDARDAAVNTAIAGLDRAAEAAGLNDDFWERIEGAIDAFYDLAQKYLAPLVEILRDVLEVLKKIVDILALIVTILAIFIPVLAPIAAALTVLSLVLGALILLCSLVLFALGKETLGRVIGDAIDLTVGIITAKLGGIKFGSVVGDAVNAGSQIAKEGLKEATSYAIETAALQFAEDTIVEISLGIGASIDMANASTNEMYISDLQGNTPWGAPPTVDQSNFAPSLAENLIETIGGMSPVGNVIFGVEHGISTGQSIITLADNVSNIWVVPAS